MTIYNALRFALGIVRGRIILNFGITERLRAFRYPIFTGGVVKGDGICSAAFCESAALRRKLLPDFSRVNPLRRSRASSPEGRAFCADRQISKAPPSGELDATSGSGLRGFTRPGKQARVLAGNLTVMPKALPLRKDFPRSGQILPAPGRNVTAGDKERNRCRAATKGGIWQSRQALTEGVRS